MAAGNLWITKEAKCSPSLLSSACGTWVFSECSHSRSPGAKLQKCHQICMHQCTFINTLFVVWLRSSQRPCWGKNVTRTGGMTVGNKRGPPVYLDNDLLRSGLLSHLLGVSPSCYSPTSVTVHPALPAGSGKFAFSFILPLKLKVCICRSFSYCFLQQKTCICSSHPLSR